MKYCETIKMGRLERFIFGVKIKFNWWRNCRFHKKMKAQKERAKYLSGYFDYRNQTLFSGLLAKHKHQLSLKADDYLLFDKNFRMNYNRVTGEVMVMSKETYDEIEGSQSGSKETAIKEISELFKKATRKSSGVIAELMSEDLSDVELDDDEDKIFH